MGRISLRTKFLAVALGMVVLLGAVTIFFVKTSIRANLIALLQQRGFAIASHIAGIAVSPVLTERFFELELALRDIESSEEDLLYIFVLDPEGTILADTFDDGIPRGLKEANRITPGAGSSIKRLMAEGKEILDIGVPLLDGSLGAVRLGLSGESVARDVDEIIDMIIWMNMAVLILVGIMAALFDRIITRPLINLADVAEAVGRGDLDRRIDMHASGEIGLLAQAFAGMLEKRSTAEREKENLITELRRALDEIKRLEGLLPICAACKKIRDDQGDWTQIETFIRERSDADFTHSICPDCARKMYPEYYKGRVASGESPRKDPPAGTS